MTLATPLKQHSPDAAGTSPLVDLCDVDFDNTFVRELPGDSLTHNVPRTVRNACYTRVAPTPVRSPQLLAWVDAVGEMLGVKPPQSASGAAAQVLAGNRVLPGMEPYAARYGGHQFGQWAGQLGDGRAITLGEVIGPDGTRYDMQLKGAARPPTRARQTVAQCCARQCGNSCAAKRCTISACRRRAH